MAHGTASIHDARGLVLLGALFTTLALAQPAMAGKGDAASAASTAPSPIAKTDWKVARAWCPIGCSALMRSLLKSEVGQPVKLSETELSAPFIDPCHGHVHLSLKPMRVQDIAAEINLALPPQERRFTAAHLGASGSPLSGWAFCKGEFDSNLQRLLVVEPDRVVLLGEEQALVELR